jgi:hypothetical protein
MTKQELIEQFKLDYPSLTKQVNNEIIVLDQDEYEATIDYWADATLAKEIAKIEAEQVRLNKISAYQKLGLTEVEIEALLPTPIDDKLNP